MASLQQIGAVIGIQGAKQYLADMKALTSITKSFETETKSLTATFDKSNLTIKNVKDLEASLKNEKAALQNELKREEEALARVNQRMQDGQALTLKEAGGQAELQAQLNNTKARINELDQQLKDLPNTAKLVTDAWKNATSDWREMFVGVGSTLTKYITVPLIGAATVSTKTAADFETSFIGVKKTVDELVGDNNEVIYSFDDLNAELQKIPLRTASSYETVAAVAEAAGQLGISIEKIPGYVETIIMLGDSTNISAEEAATSIAQFMNIMGDTSGTAEEFEVAIESFGGALVELGNNTTTDEQSILRLATRLASAGKLVGLSTPEILGLAASMSSVGLTAEAGGTAMSQAMNKITKAVASGGETLELFGEITNQTGEQFAETWRNDPIKALDEFLEGLISHEGGSEELILMLDELGFSGIRESDTLRRLTLNHKGVSEAVDMATKAYQDYDLETERSNKLTEEAEKKYGSFDSKVSQLKESMKLFGATIGETFTEGLKPVIDNLAEFFQNLTEWWKGLSEPAQKIILFIGGLVASIGPLLVILGNALIYASKIKAALEVFGGLSTIFAPLVTGLTTFGSTLVSIATGPIGWIIAAIGLFIAGCKLLGLTWDDVVEGLKGTWDALKIATEEAVDMVIGFFQNLSDNIGNKVNEIVSIVKTKFTEVKDGIVRDFTNAKEKALAIWDSMKSGISSKVSAINTAISNGINNAVEYIKSLPSQAYQWGADIISNLASGIRNSIGVVTSAVSNIGRKIRDYLGFSEPEKGPLSNFHTFMPDMMKLMAQGIDQNMYRVEDALNNVSSMMASNLEDRGNNVSYGGVVINLNVPQGTDGRTLVDQIETEIANRTMRRRMVFN